ncbi:MAG TPA: methyltransferase domain-containing protein [Candidatus Methylacidiphilales bacterium]|nr:methyltransferase domain-containing protein [Candidatus Methylacidiphilales bacterium]
MLTKGECYQVPVIHDLLSDEIIYETGQDTQNVARYIDALAGMNLFPEDTSGLQTILTHYIENECEDAGFKICDANKDVWVHTDLEKGLMRRHKERKFGVGCLDRWKKDEKELTAHFFARLAPLEQILAKQTFLMGDKATYADFALAGVIGNYLHPGVTTLHSDFIMLSAWYGKMKAGHFPKPLDELQRASHDQFSERADQYGTSHILADTSDVSAAFAPLKMRTGSKALDIATGNGHTAIYLAKQGMLVTATDISQPMLDEAKKLAQSEGAKIEFKQHIAEQIPYPDGGFHLVTCRMAAHHFSNPQHFVMESARVLRMYGYLIIIDGTVLDDHPEAEAWMHEVESLRDPSHVRFIKPRTWEKWAAECNLRTVKSEITSLKMPDLNWYMNVAGTPKENRKRILELVARAPTTAREIFKIGQEEGKIVWHWRRLTYVAGKI